MSRFLFALLALLPLASALDSVKTVRSGRAFAPLTRLPVMDHGYLFFNERKSPELDVYTPDGTLAFATVIEIPNVALTEAATDAAGHFAVAISYQKSPGRRAGAIVWLDARGKQTGMTDTDRYLPTHLCFTPEGLLWTTGWQRDAEINDREDRQDYAILRRFHPQGAQSGEFLKRSSFPKGLSPGGGHGGRWGIRAAGDRIGALLFSGMTSETMVWLEMDSSGREVGRWPLPSSGLQGLAFTKSGLYTLTLTYHEESRTSTWELLRLEGSSSTWKSVFRLVNSADPLVPEPGLLMDADGEQLIFAKDHGSILEWMTP